MRHFIFGGGSARLPATPAILALARRVTLGTATAALVTPARLPLRSTPASLRAASRAVHLPPLASATDMHPPPALAAIEPS